ncbi:GNAT family N-acetyltransferase [archaeon]
MRSTLVPTDFEVPLVLDTPRFRLRMLSLADVDKDYDAVISSVKHLKGFFGQNNAWPEGLTMEQELIDLSWHQKEFQLRSSFTYTVVTPDETKCVGCVYIFPSKKAGFDAVVFMWARESELGTGLDEELYKTVKAWIKDKWPFKNVAYPGRD